MSFDATVLQVMLASPSDTAEARATVARALNDWNAVNSESMRVVLLPVGWETHGTPSMGARAQEVLDQQLLPQSDVLIGLFWTRLGSPTGKAPSGTVEEIEEFIKAGKRALLYFSSIPVVPGNIDIDQFQALEAFRKECEHRGLLGSYESHEHLYVCVQRDLTRVVRELVTAARENSAGDVEKPEFVYVHTIPNLLEAYRHELREVQEGLRLWWLSAATSRIPEVAEWNAALQVVHERLTHFTTQISVVLNQRIPLLIADLEYLLVLSREAASFRFKMDGGRSLEQFKHLVNAVLEGLELVTSDSWTAYAERRIG